MTVQKKHEEVKESSSAKASTVAKAMVDPLSPKASDGHGKSEGQGEKAQEVSEPVVVLDVVTETTERVEVIEEVTPPAADSLTDFKEKMSEEENPMSDMPPKKNFMWPILFIFIIALLMLAGIFAYKNTKMQKINVVTLSPTPTVMPEPSKAIDLSKYPIKILNGSGVSGEASRQKSSLETEGFVVSSTGNADNSNYAKTIIQAKKEVDADFLDKLKIVLEKSFILAETEALSETTPTPVVIIIGRKK